MKKLIAAALVMFAAAGCSKPVKAQVDCKEHTGGFACSVATQGGQGNYNVCWSIKVTCADGQKLGADTCQEIGADGKASSVVPNAKFTGGTCKVGKVTGVAVDNMKITAK